MTSFVSVLAAINEKLPKQFVHTVRPDGSRTAKILTVDMKRLSGIDDPL
ncbi:MAG: hypothetical protein JRH15_12510 [Deltaproteobacteria bacterium]|nr:hypothetical protein [Deltaproteobacteria bacterium]